MSDTPTRGGFCETADNLATDGSLDGLHVFQFSAVDAAGNSTSRELSFVLDTRAPVLAITSLNEELTFFGSSGS